MANEAIAGEFINSASREEREQLYNRALAQYGAAIKRIAGAYSQTPSDRDDLVQDIAMAFWQSLPQFRNESSLKTFLFRIAQNRAISYLSRSRRNESDLSGEIEIPDRRPDPEILVSREQQRKRLQEAVAQLPLPYRQVIVLALEEFEYEEIAETLGISTSNVGARLSRGRKLLRQLMGVAQ